MVLQIKVKEKSLGGYLGEKQSSKLIRDLRDEKERLIDLPSLTESSPQ